MLTVKRNDAQAQQALDREKPVNNSMLRVLTAAETRNIAAGAVVSPGFMLGNPMAQ